MGLSWSDSTIGVNKHPTVSSLPRNPVTLSSSMTAECRASHRAIHYSIRARVALHLPKVILHGRRGRTYPSRDCAGWNLL